jgi:hypothetical protein
MVDMQFAWRRSTSVNTQYRRRFPLIDRFDQAWPYGSAIQSDATGATSGKPGSERRFGAAMCFVSERSNFISSNLRERPWPALQKLTQML